jgi:hypothetical protein
MDTLIITKEQAIAQGTSPGMLRVIANSVERLGRGWLHALQECKSDEQTRSCKERANVNFTNARNLRFLAKNVERELKK